MLHVTTSMEELYAGVEMVEQMVLTNPWDLCASRV